MRRAARPAQAKAFNAMNMRGEPRKLEALAVNLDTIFILDNPGDSIDDLVVLLRLRNGVIFIRGRERGVEQGHRNADRLALRQIDHEFA